MLNIFTVQNEKPKGIRERVSSFIHPYEIKTRIRSAAGIKIRETVYIRRRGKINWHAVAKSIGESRAILCEKDLTLLGSPFRKTESSALGAAWCEKFVCQVLETLAESDIYPRISFYDPFAEFSDFAKDLSSYTEQLTVITEMPKFYENEAQYLHDTTGAVMKVTNDTDRIFPCDMLIIPDKLRDIIHAPALTPVFTSCPAYVSLSGTVIDGYCVSLPEIYRPLCPDGIDETELMNALYDTENANILAGIVPESALCAGKKITVKEAAELVKRSITPLLSSCD